MDTLDIEDRDESTDEIEKMLIEADCAAENSDVRMTREEVFSRLKRSSRQNTRPCGATLFAKEG